MFEDLQDFDDLRRFESQTTQSTNFDGEHSQNNSKASSPLLNFQIRNPISAFMIQPLVTQEQEMMDEDSDQSSEISEF